MMYFVVIYYILQTNLTDQQSDGGCNRKQKQ